MLPFAGAMELFEARLANLAGRVGRLERVRMKNAGLPYIIVVLVTDAPPPAVSLALDVDALEIGGADDQRRHEKENR